MARRRNTDAPELDLAVRGGTGLRLGRKTTQELVREVLREAILSGRLQEGVHLIQDQIAAQLGVSRIPVREALLQLESDGFVRIEAHRGASVIYHSPQDIEELCEIRAILLSAAVRLAVPELTDAQIDKLDEISRRQDVEVSMATRARLNRAFYAALFANLERPRLLALVEKLRLQVERYLIPVQRPHLGHQDVIDACRRRDGDVAADLLYEHVTAVGRRAVEHMRKMGVDAWPAKGDSAKARRGSGGLGAVIERSPVT